MNISSSAGFEKVTEKVSKDVIFYSSFLLILKFANFGYLCKKPTIESLLGKRSSWTLTICYTHAKMSIYWSVK